MKVRKISALVLVLAMVLPFVVSCGQSGTPVSYPNVTIISTMDPLAAPVEEETGTETAEETAEPAPAETTEEEPYEEVLFSGEVVVYVDVEEGEEPTVTVYDVVKAYTDAYNLNLVYDESLNMITKIDEISRGAGYNWLYVVNGSDAGLNTVVKPEDEIQIIFTK